MVVFWVSGTRESLVARYQLSVKCTFWESRKSRSGLGDGNFLLTGNHPRPATAKCG